MFTPTAICANAGISRCHRRSCRQAWVSTSLPSGTMRPVSSAMEMNASGITSPRVGVAPAHQRLEGGEPTGAVDNRLVVELELVALDGVAELRLRRPAGHGPLVHLRIEHAGAALARLLGLVERGVGVAQHLVGRGCSRRRWWRCRCSRARTARGRPGRTARPALRGRARPPAGRPRALARSSSSITNSSPPMRAT